MPLVPLANDTTSLTRKPSHFFNVIRLVGLPSSLTRLREAYEIFDDWEDNSATLEEVPGVVKKKEKFCIYNVIAKLIILAIGSYKEEVVLMMGFQILRLQRELKCQILSFGQL